MKISKKEFGVLSNGKRIYLYTLKAGDLKFSLTNFGAAWTSLVVPSRNGKSDVLLGYSGVDGWLNNSPFFGVTIGRFANRIGGAAFTLDGKKYRLDKNDGENTLHGGRRGFDKLIWKATAYEENESLMVRFELESPAGDRGFPGELDVAVTYGLTKSNEIIAVYEAKADAPTPVSLTNHAYFNLAGEGEGNILSHEVCLCASAYVELDGQLIPTGAIKPVKDTPYDFRNLKPVNRDLCARAGGDGKSGAPDGYDNFFVVDGKPGKLRPCAELVEPSSGRSMKVFATQPGVQFYTGNMLPGMNGKAGSVYAKYSGLCLETGHFPDAPNQPDFPSSIFGPDRDYSEKTVFSFDW
ncbi:MAG TPA: galactose-1-epimerase [Treponema sp.]|nr:galactose-1-epimerase [Treponema sp.]